MERVDVEFRLLGPIEVRAAGRSLPAGEPRQQLVLAALLADAGRTIGVDTLVSRVWGDEPPKQARRACMRISPGSEGF